MWHRDELGQSLFITGIFLDLFFTASYLWCDSCFFQSLFSCLFILDNALKLELLNILVNWRVSKRLRYFDHLDSNRTPLVTTDIFQICEKSMQLLRHWDTKRYLLTWVKKYKFAVCSSEFVGVLLSERYLVNCTTPHFVLNLTARIMAFTVFFLLIKFRFAFLSDI